MKKKIKKLTKFEEGIEGKKKKNDFAYPEKVLLGGVNYVREDQAVKYVNSMPEEVKQNFLIRKPRRRWYNPFSWFGKEEEFKPKGNFLFLLDNEGNIRIWDKVQSGVFRINQDLEIGENAKDVKFITLKPTKLRNITFEDEEGDEYYWKGWVADINNSVALPNEPEYDSEDVADTITKAVQGNRAFNQKEGGWNIGGWLPWVFGAMVVIYLGYIAVSKNLMGIGDLVGFGKDKVVETATTIIQNATNQSVPGGTIT